MMILVETSVMIAASLFWSYKSVKGNYELRGKGYKPCRDLFNHIKNKKSLQVVISKTVEKEAENTLNKAVIDALESEIKRNRIPDFVRKIKFMILQDIITNESMDKLEAIIEEYSTRLPIDISERDGIKNKELKPFFDKIIPTTIRYIRAPHIPKMKGSKTGKNDIYEAMIETLPRKGIVYKGYPEDRDLTIMAEAALICRKYCKVDPKIIFAASLDNHFKPNPKFIGSFLSNKRRFTGVDSTIRDELEKLFGFRGQHPIDLLEDIKEAD